MIEFKNELVTPEYAKELLEKNTTNRKIKLPVILRYTKDMLDGKWKENTGEVIKISKSGTLIDGQHRLTAVVKSNVSVKLCIARGVDDNVFDVLDTGSIRTAGDVFSIQHIKNARIAPGVINFYNLLKSGVKQKSQNKHQKSTNAELLDQYYEEGAFWKKITEESLSLYNDFAKILSPAFIGGFYAFLFKCNPEKAPLFIKEMCTGLNIQNEVISLLRNKLMQDKMAIRKMPQVIKMALVIKAWNCYVSGISPKLLKYNPNTEEFPVAIKES